VDRGTKAAAEVVLESNPQLKTIHSKASVAKVIEKAQGS